jgi:transposase-like protein
MSRNKRATIPTDAEAEERYVYVEAPKCPKCRSTHLLTYRTTRTQGDGSVARHKRCRTCDRRFIVVYE